MLTTFMLGLVSFIASTLMASPFIVGVCTAPFILLAFFGSSRGLTHTQLAGGAMGAFIPVGAWLAAGFYAINFDPNFGGDWLGWLGLGLPIPTLVMAAVGVKLGTRWEHRHDPTADEASQPTLSFLKPTEAAKDTAPDGKPSA